MTDLRNARIVEVGTPEQNGILIRAKRGDPFTRIGGVEDGEAGVDETPLKFYEGDLRRNDQMTVLAEFPLTLADLLPNGCTAFRFQCANETLVAARDTNGRWTVTGRNAWWETLDALTAYFDINLGTVIPLTVHADYIEARR